MKAYFLFMHGKDPVEVWPIDVDLSIVGSNAIHNPQARSRALERLLFALLQMLPIKGQIGVAGFYFTKAEALADAKNQQDLIQGNKP